MNLFTFLPLLLVVLFYFVILGLILFLIYTWVTKFISLRQEQNNLLREIIKKMDNNTKATI